MLISIPIEMLHQTNCFYILAPMYTKEKGFGFVGTPLSYELLESECKAINDMLKEAVTYYEENSSANRINLQKPNGASGNLRTDDNGESIPYPGYIHPTNPSGD